MTGRSCSTRLRHDGAVGNIEKGPNDDQDRRQRQQIAKRAARSSCALHGSVRVGQPDSSRAARGTRGVRTRQSSSQYSPIHANPPPASIPDVPRRRCGCHIAQQIKRRPTGQGRAAAAEELNWPARRIGPRGRWSRSQASATTPTEQAGRADAEQSQRRRLRHRRAARRDRRQAAGDHRGGAGDGPPPRFPP